MTSWHDVLPPLTRLEELLGSGSALRWSLLGGALVAIALVRLARRARDRSTARRLRAAGALLVILLALLVITSLAVAAIRRLGVEATALGVLFLVGLSLSGSLVTLSREELSDPSG